MRKKGGGGGRKSSVDDWVGELHGAGDFEIKRNLRLWEDRGGEIKKKILGAPPEEENRALVVVKVRSD